MPVIHRHLVARSRKPRRCDGAGISECLKRIPAGSSYFRIYGYAHRGERPYRLHLCVECMRGHDALRFHEQEKHFQPPAPEPVEEKPESAPDSGAVDPGL